MPTFHDPTHDAAEASEALRGLAHATRTVDDPADTYAVIGSLLPGVRSLRQVIDQLATAHLDHRLLAHDDAGDHAAGPRRGHGRGRAAPGRRAAERGGGAAGCRVPAVRANRLVPRTSPERTVSRPSRLTSERDGFGDPFAPGGLRPDRDQGRPLSM